MKSTSPNQGPSQFDTLGQLVWLWMSSPLQREWTLQAGARFLLPAITLGQFHVLEREQMPVAYCSWAWLSAEAEMRYLLDPSSLQPEDWNSGERLWFIDWVAPFAARDSWQLRGAMVVRFSHTVARAIRVKRERKHAWVMAFKGRALASVSARAQLQAYQSEFIGKLQQPAMQEADQRTQAEAQTTVCAS